jgi:DNA-binding beta-propeller fold protein YncE
MREDVHRLPTGVLLDPAGRVTEVGQFPLAMIPSPDPDRIVLLLNGYRDQGIQVVSRSTGRVMQTVLLPAAFLGIVFDARGEWLYAAGGDQDVVYRLAWQNGGVQLRDSLVLAAKPARQAGTRYPGGLSLSPDNRLLYVAENLADSLAVLETATGRIVQRLAAGRYPYGVVTAPDGSVYVSAWGGFEVSVFRPEAGRLEAQGSIRVGRHPSAMLLNRDGSRLYVASASTDRVAIVDTRDRRVVGELVDTIPGGTGEGSTPNALALSQDERRLFVAEADNNAIAVFDLAGAGGQLVGRIPAGWYPAAVLVQHDTLLVANAKGRRAGPNAANGPGPGRSGREGYTLSQLSGTLSTLPLGELAGGNLAALSGRVARANGWAGRSGVPGYPPFEHVVYIIKENRTYDQVFGDLPQGDGDSSLTYFPRPVSVNHHALAERFGLFDRFFTNAEVSADGHNWSTAAYATDYTQKTTQQNYSGRGRSYDYQGQNRGVRPAQGEDAAEPANGYLWDLARRRGITFRNFGEFAELEGQAGTWKWAGLKPFLEGHTDPAYPGWDLEIPDQRRADVWLRNLAGWERDGAMPALQVLTLPNDHTAGARAGALSPRAYMADNDLALGRIIEGLSRSRFWRNTVVFVLEDDAQNGPDHVDSHRSVLLVVSAWNRGGVWHRFVNTTDVIATIVEILGLENLSQFDAFGRPLRGIFASAPNLAPYAVLRPSWSLTDRNPARGGPGAEEAATLDFGSVDAANEEAFNRSLWLALKGNRPYPGTTRRIGTSP